MTDVPVFATAREAFVAADKALRGGDPVAAAAILRNLPEAFPSKENVAVAASGLRTCGYWSEAVALLEDAIAKGVASAALSDGLADAYLEIKDYSRAAGCIARYLTQVPDNAVMWINLGNIHSRSGDWVAAEQAYARALSLKPDFDTILRHGDALYRLGRLSEAVATYRRATVIKPDDARGYLKLGSALVMQPDPAEGKHVLFRAIALDPANAEAHANLAGYYQRTGNLQRAIQAAREAIERNADFIPAYVTLGSVLLEAGEHQNAAAILRIGADLAPESVVVLRELAAAENALDNPRAAERILQRIIAVDPGNLEARHMLAAVNGEPVRSVPAGYSVQVFNRYAPQFDRMLTGASHYRAPEEILALLADAKPESHAFKQLLDLGCGTGLVAAALVKKYAFTRAIGVDIAERMAEISRQKDLYDEVIQGEVADVLAANVGGLDLITAVDLFTYIGDLAPLMPLIAGALPPDGILAYSIEPLAEGRYKLQRNGRFAHNPKYVEDLARTHGLVPLAVRSVVLRKENSVDVQGQVGLLRRG